MNIRLRSWLARLNAAAWAAARRDERFLSAVTAGREVWIKGISETRLDTGGWFRGARLAFALEPGGLRLFARGRKPFTADLPFRAIADSRYNHVTGELMLAPGEELPVKRLRLPPRTAEEMLGRIAGR